MAGALRPLPRFFCAPPVHGPVRVSSAAFSNCYQHQAQSCGSSGSGVASRRCYRVGRTPRHRALNGRAQAPQKPAREARSSATVSHITQVPGTQPGESLLTHPLSRPRAAVHAQLFAWPGATGEEPASSCAEASGKPAWWMQPRPPRVTGEHARVVPVNKAPNPRPAWWLQPRLGAFVVAKRPSWWLEQRPSNVFGLAARWKKTNPVINAKPSWWTQPRPLCTTYGRKPTLATAIAAAGPCLRRRLVLGTIVGLPMGVPVDPIPVGSGAEAPLECPRPPSGTGPHTLDHSDARPLSLHELVGQLTEYFERTGFHEDKAAKIADLDRILSRFEFSQGDWQQYAVCDRQHRYTRNLLATDEHYFSLSLICWHEGVDSPIHSHPSDGCWMQVTRGSVVERRFVPNTATGELEQTQERIYEPGTTFFINDSQGYHQVESLGGDACTLHLYSPPLQHAVAWQNGENLSTGRSSDIGHHYDHGVKPCKLERFEKQSGQ